MSTPLNSPSAHDTSRTTVKSLDTASPIRPEPATERTREVPVVLDSDPVVLNRSMPVDRAAVVARQKERFGGMKAGPAFFGWLAATGMAVMLITLLTAAGVAFGIASHQSVDVDQAVQDAQNATSTAQTIGLIGGIALLVVLFMAYYCGGYVAGRMARFSGIKQGLAVWLWGILTAVIIAAIAAIAGSKYDIFAQLSLPRIPVNEGQVTTAGIIAIAAAMLAALSGALLGGLTGMRFHRKVDAAGLDAVDHHATRPIRGV